jgi:hypothetical protein
MRLTDEILNEEWGYFETFLIRRGKRPPRNHRRSLDAVFDWDAGVWKLVAGR